MAWDRASRIEYDAWGNLSDSKIPWNWDTLLPYFIKAENASSISDVPDRAPSLSRSDADIAHSKLAFSETVGMSGPVKVRAISLCLARAQQLLFDRLPAQLL